MGLNFNLQSIDKDMANESCAYVLTPINDHKHYITYRGEITDKWFEAQIYPTLEEAERDLRLFDEPEKYSVIMLVVKTSCDILTTENAKGE